MNEALDDVRRYAKLIRAQAVKMVHRSRASHLGSCLSMADILTRQYRQAKMSAMERQLPK